MTLQQRPNRECSARFQVFTSFVSNIDLAISAPGYGASSGRKQLPRQVAWTGGNLVVILEEGTTVTIPDTFSPQPIAPRTIDSSTAATSVLVLW